MARKNGTRRSKMMRVDQEIFAPEIEQLMKDKDFETSRQATRDIGKKLRSVRVGSGLKKGRIRF